ncbi:MAG: hypothetical protein AVDCRST_MAG25-2587, partial [uncultured Rubrobacteraceae bacterium]
VLRPPGRSSVEARDRIPGERQDHPAVSGAPGARGGEGGRARQRVLDTGGPIVHIGIQRIMPRSLPLDAWRL